MLDWAYEATSPCDAMGPSWSQPSLFGAGGPVSASALSHPADPPPKRPLSDPHDSDSSYAAIPANWHAAAPGRTPRVHDNTACAHDGMRMLASTISRALRVLPEAQDEEAAAALHSAHAPTTPLTGAKARSAPPGVTAPSGGTPPIIPSDSPEMYTLAEATIAGPPPRSERSSGSQALAASLTLPMPQFGSAFDGTYAESGTAQLWPQDAAPPPPPPASHHHTHSLPSAAARQEPAAASGAQNYARNAKTFPALGRKLSRATSGHAASGSGLFGRIALHRQPSRARSSTVEAAAAAYVAQGGGSTGRHTADALTLPHGPLQRASRTSGSALRTSEALPVPTAAATDMAWCARGLCLCSCAWRRAVPCATANHVALGAAG